MMTKKHTLLLVMAMLLCPALVLVISSLAMQQAVAKGLPPKIEGIFWQVDQMSHPTGNWQLLGIHTLVTQWSMVDDRSFFSEIPLQQWDVQPDWPHIAQQAWSKQVILGLAGIFQEPVAREHMEQLYQQSQQILKAHLPIHASGYYFPVEADPTWNEVHLLGRYLARFKQPIWVSIYSADRKAPFLQYWLASWLPANGKVFFQDGVGVGTRTPQEAAQIYAALKQQFGEDRVIILLEAFRKKEDGSFRAAYPWEITKQLKAYGGQRVYIFDGPHYLNRASVIWLYVWMKIHY